MTGSQTDSGENLGESRCCLIPMTTTKSLRHESMVVGVFNMAHLSDRGGSIRTHLYVHTPWAVGHSLSGRKAEKREGTSTGVYMHMDLETDTRLHEQKFFVLNKNRASLHDLLTFLNDGLSIFPSIQDNAVSHGRMRRGCTPSHMMPAGGCCSSRIGAEHSAYGGAK